MRVQTGRTIFCCVLLWSHALTDAYGLSQKSTKNKTDKQATARKSVTHSTVTAHNRELKSVKLAPKAKQPVKAIVLAERKPGNKMVVEINELQRMYQQLNQEKVSNTDLGRKQQLLQHIQNQIQLRQQKQVEKQKLLLQQQQQQQRKQQLQQQNHHIRVEQRPQLTNTRQIHQLFNPMQSVSTNADQHLGNLQHINHRVALQSGEQQQLGSQNLQAQTSVLNSHMLPNSRVQNNVVLPQGQIPQFIQAEPLRLIDTQPVSRPLVSRHIGQQQQHVLVPLSALSSGQILNAQGMMSDKIILVNSLARNDGLTGPNAGLVQQKPPTTPLTTIMATTKPTTTTEQPTTVAPTSPPTTPSNAEIETSTVMDADTMKQTILQRTLRKQALEIRKLQLEIRALQRQERNNMPEENEDGPQPMRFRQRQMFYPFVR